MRTGGQVLVDQLELHGVEHAFCVPGESYLAVLDALHDSDIRLISCRHEAAAANMAEAYGKLTGRPGVCLVTRGPGATHASVGVHIASQDSTPMILLVGQVPRPFRGREAIAAAYREQPPDDEIVLLDGGPRYAWARGPARPAGEIHLTERDGVVTGIRVLYERFSDA